MAVKELEKIMEQLEKENTKIEKAQNRKIKKGGVFEAFEREITGMQEETNNDLIYAFLDYVLSDNRYREKLKELTEIHLKDRGIGIEETENPDDENDKLDNQKEENLDEDLGADFLESED